jgi:multisubunit Na+/H+ antiporter MnhE subunit
VIGLAWGAALFVVWLALTDKTSPLELLVGGCSALVAGVVTMVAARKGRVALRPNPRWLLAFPKALWWVPRDSAIVLAALAGRLLLRRVPAGRLVPVAFDLGDDGARGQARRAIAFGAGSAGPNSYVVGASREVQAIVVHQLVATDEIAPSKALGES